MNRYYQLPFPFLFKPRLGREDFLVGASNAEAFGAVTLWPEWGASHVWILCGPQGAGKSHLASIWKTAAKAHALCAADIDLREVLERPTGSAFLIESLDSAFVDETRAFHLLNLIREKRDFLLITARTFPKEWPLLLPDLISRIRSAPVASITAPTEDLLWDLLIKHFHDRQIDVDENVVAYLLQRIERSFASVAKIVEILDRETLARRRPVTRAMAARILNQLSSSQAIQEKTPPTGNHKPQ